MKEKTKIILMVAIITIVAIVGTNIYLDRVEKISNGEMTIQHNGE